MVKYDSQTIVDHTDFILLPVNLQKFLLVDSRKPEDSCVIIIQRLIQHLLNITSMKMRQFQLIHIDCVGRFRLQKFHHLHNIRKTGNSLIVSLCKKLCLHCADLRRKSAVCHHIAHCSLPRYISF